MMRFILLIAIFFGIIGYGQVKPLTLEDVPEEVKTVVDSSSLTFVVTKQPEFPGGLDEFKKKFKDNFDAASLKDSVSGIVKSTIYYVVENDGTVNRIKAVGNNEAFNKEAERALKAINAKYEPASVNNIPVRYLMRLPLNMKFK